MPAETTPIPPWAPCKRPLGCDYPDCECHSQTTADRLKAAEDFVRDELRIMGQTEDETIIKRVAVTIAKRMERVQNV